VACSAEAFEAVLMDAFNRTDEEFGKADNAALVGTTAVVALVGSRQLYVANCGARPSGMPRPHACRIR
jgi:protein phosphatase 2C